MDNLTNLNVNETFQRLLQKDPDEDRVIDGTGSVYLIPTSSIKNWNTSINSTVSALGYIRDTGVVFTTRPNTGSINLKGDINANGNVSISTGINEMIRLSNSGSIWLEDYIGNPTLLPIGSFFFSGSDFYIVNE